MERVLKSDPGVGVFALQYSTQKGRLLRSAVVLANHKDNIETCPLKNSQNYAKMLKNSVAIAMEDLILYMTHIRNYCVYGSLRL